MMDECVTTIGLCKRYGSETCVDHLALKVPQGAVYGFLGPNGAGKTTTLKMLLGLVHPSAGSVRLLGHELTPRTRLAILREVGSLIESPSYYGHLTARENLEIVRRLRGLPAEEIDEALRTVRLDGQVKKTVNHFSLGMKQRLGIAAALMGRPRLLLLDAMSDSEAARVSLKLAGAGIGLVRMEQRETSLEDIFLRLTGTEETL